MPLDNPKAGFNYAPEFQTPGLPWVASGVTPSNGSPLQIDFPFVTNNITIYNRDTAYSSSMSVGFTNNGILSGNRFVIQGGQTLSFNLRVKTIFIQGEPSYTPPYTIAASLTSILPRMMPTLTGTLGDGTSGWSGVG